MFGTNQSHLLQQEWSLCCHRQPSHPLDSNLCQPKILFCQNSNILETNESWICNVPIYIIYIKIHIFPFNCLAPRLLFVICRVDLYNLYFMFCNLYAMKIHIIFKWVPALLLSLTLALAADWSFVKTYLKTTFLKRSPTEQYIRKFIELESKQQWLNLVPNKTEKVCSVHWYCFYVWPVDGEEEMVDADGDGIPLRCVETARTKAFSWFQGIHDHTHHESRPALYI